TCKIASLAKKKFRVNFIIWVLATWRQSTVRAAPTCFFSKTLDSTKSMASNYVHFCPEIKGGKNTIVIYSQFLNKQKNTFQNARVAANLNTWPHHAAKSAMGTFSGSTTTASQYFVPRVMYL